MDRGAWQVTVHGVTRVGQDLATKPTPMGKLEGKLDRYTRKYFEILR